jgi:hypothetical protein
MLSRTLPYCIAVSILRAAAVVGAQVMTSPNFTPTSIAPAPTSPRPTIQATPNIQLNCNYFFRATRTAHRRSEAQSL